MHKPIDPGLAAELWQGLVPQLERLGLAAVPRAAGEEAPAPRVMLACDFQNFVNSDAFPIGPDLPLGSWS